MSSPPRKRGRPLSFDRQAALHQAMLQFWRHGYEATSLNDLTAAMGVTDPSIYAALGDKKSLFLEAVGRSLSAPSPSKASSATPPRRRTPFAGGSLSAIGDSGEDTPPGCLLASAAISCSPAGAGVQRSLAAIRISVESQLRARIERAMQTGELLPTADPEGLAGQVMATVQGLSTLARDGADRVKSLRVADAAMLAWCVLTPAPSRRKARPRKDKNPIGS